MADRPSPPLLPACRLWEKTSARGTTYLVGRWGGVKVLIMPNRDRQVDDEPTHMLLLTEAAQPRRLRQVDRAAVLAGQVAAVAEVAEPPHQRPRRRRSRSRAEKVSRVQVPDDPVPF
jgi:hypothetical protein